MDGWMDAGMDRWMDAGIDGCRDGWMDGLTKGWIHGWVHDNPISAMGLRTDLVIVVPFEIEKKIAEPLEIGKKW